MYPRVSAWLSLCIKVNVLWYFMCSYFPSKPKSGICLNNLSFYTPSFPFISFTCDTRNRTFGHKAMSMFPNLLFINKPKTKFCTYLSSPRQLIRACGRASANSLRVLRSRLHVKRVFIRGAPERIMVHSTVRIRLPSAADTLHRHASVTTLIVDGRLELSGILIARIRSDWDRANSRAHVHRVRRDVACRCARRLRVAGWVGEAVSTGLPPARHSSRARVVEVWTWGPFGGEILVGVRTDARVCGDKTGIMLQGLLPVRPLHAPTSAVVALLKHVLAGGIKRPVVSFPLSASLTRNFNEALVQGEVVADRVLPALFILLVEWEFVDDVLVDAVQGQSLLRWVADGHGNQGDVGIRRFHVGVFARIFRSLVLRFVARNYLLLLHVWFDPVQYLVVFRWSHVAITQSGRSVGGKSVAIIYKLEFLKVFGVFTAIERTDWPGISLSIANYKYLAITQSFVCLSNQYALYKASIDSFYLSGCNTTTYKDSCFIWRCSP